MSTQFVFRLARLMELRERRMQECQKELAQALRRVQEGEAHVRAIRAMQADLNRSWREIARGKVDAQTALDYERARLSLVESEKKSLEQVLKLREAQSECQVKLDRALAALKALQKLQDKSRTKFIKEASVREQAAYDDFSMLRQRQSAV